MFTIVKREKQNTTYTLISVDDFVRNVQGMQYVYNRQTYIRIGGEFSKRGGNVVMRNRNSLIVLKVPILGLPHRLDSIREELCRIPYTYLAWSDLEEGTIVVVCRYDRQKEVDAKDEAAAGRVLLNAYKRLHYHYSSQLRIGLAAEQPEADEECRCVHDEQIYYNPESMVMYVDDRDVEIPVYRPAEEDVSRHLPGMNDAETMFHLYHLCVEKAQLEVHQSESKDEGRDSLFLTALSERCFDSGLPMEFGCSLTLLKSRFCNKELLVRKAFESAYADDLLGAVNFSVVNKNALLIMRTEAYLKAWYEMRLNELSGVVQWRERTAYEYDFKDLTEEDMNSMTLRAIKAGLGSWDKDVQRILHSNELPRYNPLTDYLDNLPVWDGVDRVAPLACRIPSDMPHLAEYLHVWLLSMVAHWMGKDTVHGNAVVPLLIGHQGCGKTTFASLLLPECLRAYYNDKVDFRSEGDLMSALSNFALINIDEFDSLKKSQQPTLKYLLSKGEVKVRPVYGKVIVRRRRYASFIATTNLEYPLRDYTGSRRFICIKVRPGENIDTQTLIDYDQLYAQLQEELRQGTRFWFDDQQTAAIQQANAPYLYISSFSEVIDRMFCLPVKDEGEWMSVEEVINLLTQEYPYLNRSNSTNRDVGRLLREKKYEYKKTNACAKYLMKRQE